MRSDVPKSTIDAIGQTPHGFCLTLKAALDETLPHHDNENSIRAVPAAIGDLEQLKITLASLSLMRVSWGENK
jgi:hypothetical protein